MREQELVRMDAMREKERVCMEHNAIIILYDDKYDSERRPIPYKPVM